MFGEEWGVFEVVEETPNFYLVKFFKREKTKHTSRHALSKKRVRDNKNMRDDEEEDNGLDYKHDDGASIALKVRPTRSKKAFRSIVLSDTEEEEKKNDEEQMPKNNQEEKEDKKEEEEEDEDNGKLFRAKYEKMITEDEESNSDENRLQWRDATYQPLDRCYYYDRKGSVLWNKEQRIKNGSHFLVLKNGTVISPDYKNGVVLACYLEGRKTKVAPGCVTEIFQNEEDQNITMVEFQWLLPNREYNPHKELVHQEDFENNALPLSSILMSASMLSRAVKEKLTPNYVSCLHAWEAHFETQQSALVGGLYSFLEFFHAAPQYIWHTIVGRHIMQKWIRPWQYFGNQPDTHSLEIISNVMSNPKTFAIANISDKQKFKDQCDSCKLARVMGATVTCGVEEEEVRTYVVGADCACRIEYFHAIGLSIYKFRHGYGYLSLPAGQLMLNAIAQHNVQFVHEWQTRRFRFSE